MTPPSKRDILIEGAVGEVRKLVSKELRGHSRRVDAATVHAEAHIALVSAADGYDPERGSWSSRWRTMVRSRVRRAIQGELRATGAQWAMAANTEASDVSHILPEGYMRGLDKREARLLRMRYEDGRTFEEIGIHLHLSRGRVSEIHGRLLAQLRERIDGGTL